MKSSLLSIFLIVFSLSFFSVSGQNYKSMMDDYNYNFYDVVKEAEQYFSTHSTGKGSGYKGYQRWKYENEGKFFPSGNRSNISPYFVQNAWKSVKASQPGRGSRAGQNSWVDLGPYDANTVTSHYSQGIGRVETIFVDPTDSNKMYLGSRSGGFWRTSNGGTTWECTTDTMIATGVSTLSASVTNSDSVVIGLRNANNGYSQGVYTSIDGGTNWKLSGMNPTTLGWGGLGNTGRVNVVAVSPFDSKTIYVGTERGLYKSTNFLGTFTRVVTSGNYTQVVFHPTDPNTVYAYDKNNPNRNYVRKTSNGGTSFTSSATIPGNNSNTNVKLKVSKACSNCVFFASSNGVWRSTDGGSSFVFRGKSTTGSTGSQGFAVNDLDTSNVVYGYVDLDASIDGGVSYTQRTWWATGNSNHTGSSYIHADLRVAESVNGVFYVGTDGYMAKSKDGGISWTLLSDGTGIREYYRFGMSQSKERLSMAGSQDNGTTIHVGDSSIEWNGGDGMEAVVQTLNEDWMVGSWQYGNRNRTTNGGLTRHNVDHADGSDWIAPMFFDPNHQMRIYSFSNKIYKSETFGRNWQKMDSISSNIKHATIAENNSNIMLIVRNAELQISYDGGASLTDVSSNLPHGRSISDIAFDPLNDSTVVITYDSYQNDNRRIYISYDLCQTWNNISYNLSNMPLRTVVIDHSDSHYLYVGGEIGVYYKSMNAKQWTLYSDKLPNVSVRELDVQWATNTLRAVTWGRGMWEVKLVDRENYPSITNIDVSEKPTDQKPVEDLPIHVNAEVDYLGTLSEVYVMWSKDSASLGTKIPMSLVAGKEYKTNNPIPNFVKGTELYFKVFAKATNGLTTESYKFNYVYKECTSRPTVRISTSKSNVCANEVFQLFAGGGLTYEWTNGASSGAPMSITQTTSFKVTGRDANGCAGSDSLIVTVSSPSVVAGASRIQVCKGDTFVLSGSGAQSYVWSDNVSDGIPVTANKTTMYVVEGTDINGCTAKDSVQIQVFNPIVRATASKANVCKGDTFFVNAGGAATFTWNHGAVSTVPIVATESKTYTVIGEIGPGCTGTDSIRITVDSADTRVVLNGNTITALANQANYQWLDCKNSNSILTGETQNNFTSITTGDFAVEVTQNGCIDTSECLVIIGENASNVKELNAFEALVFPNPVSDLLRVELPENIEKVNVTLTDVLGKVVLSESFESTNNFRLSVDHLDNGTYYLVIDNQRSKSTYKITKVEE
ncbi:MAG: T9SS type A sorting domain-containing protein [Salibacteraceae bacterium]